VARALLNRWAFLDLEPIMISAADIQFIRHRFLPLFL
jgi:hypothetical protein